MNEPGYAFDVIAFDADDTLWHSERLYIKAQEELKRLLEKHVRGELVGEKVHEIEMRNLDYYGYGIKGFALSLIEAAIELTEGHITGGEIQEVINLAKGMLTADVELFEGAEETVAKLAEQYSLMMITKGDLFDQEVKIARSGLGKYFRYIEIVSEKKRETYAALLARYRLDPSRFLMVGNSLRSDILPVIELGGQAVYIPYSLTWEHERVAPGDASRKGYMEIEHLGLLPDLIEELGHGSNQL